LRYDGCSAVAAIQHSDINSLLHGVIRSLATTRLHKAVLQAVLIFIVHVSTMLMHLHISYGYSNMIGVALVHFPFLPRSQGETGGGDGDDVARFDELLAPSTTGEPSPLDDEEFVAATMPDVCESCDRLTGRHFKFLEVLSEFGGGEFWLAGWLAGWLRNLNDGGETIAG
jgi:hypothetical protein